MGRPKPGPGKKRKPDGEPRGLTIKQRVFIDALLGRANHNATEAARIAGYAIPEASGKENLRKPLIRKVIDEYLAESAMSAKEALSHLSAIARGSIGDFLEIDEKSNDYVITLYRAKQSGKIALIQEIKPSRDGLGIRLYSKLEALAMIGKHHHLFLDMHVPPQEERPPRIDVTDDPGLGPRPPSRDQGGPPAKAGDRDP